MISIEQLKTNFADATFPKRWESFASSLGDDAADFLEEASLRGFCQTYPVFRDGFDTLLAAAEEIRANAALTAYAVLLSRAIADFDVIQEDIAALTLPTASEGEAALGYGLMPLIACVPHIARAIESLRSRGVADAVIYATFAYFERAITTPIKKGEPPVFAKGQLSWCQHYLHGIILRIGRLEFHWIDDMYGGNFGVYRSNEGQYRLLAERGSYHKNGALVTGNYPAEEGDFDASFTETDAYYEANLMGETGMVHPDLVKLGKDKWTRVAGYESPVVTVHIPSGPGLSKENIDAAFHDALAIHKRAFSDYKANFFHCHSWLLDTQHRMYLSPDSNILAFQSKFIHGTTNTCDNCVFTFLFNARGYKDALADLPEDTSMRRVVKRYMMAGNHIYEQNGIVPMEWIEREG